MTHVHFFPQFKKYIYNMYLGYKMVDRWIAKKECDAERIRSKKWLGKKMQNKETETGMKNGT